MKKKIGKQSIALQEEVYIAGSASVVGPKEGDGPFGTNFDVVGEDEKFGASSWESAECMIQQKVVNTLLDKTCWKAEDIRYTFAGDLLAQSTASAFGTGTLQRPFFGLFGACSTIGEGISLGSMAVAGGFADAVMAVTSSHFGSAEKEFRFPLEYGNQRPLCASWTVTGGGGVLLTNKKSAVQVTGITTGIIVDYGLKDSQNMGACMAPAAADTIYANLMDLGRKPEDYDRIITGDLGEVGRTILLDLLKQKGFSCQSVHEDCGMLIFDPNMQDTHAGGSGCGCAASMLSAYVMPKLITGEWKRVLFVPTGALLSRVSFAEGRSIPGIAHGVVLEHVL